MRMPIVVLIAMLADGAAHADPAGTMPLESRQQFYGPLRARDLTPFGYLRLDMRPAFAGSIELGRWAIDTEFAYQNTWALSGPVERYLRSRPRRNLTADDVVALRALPGENYLVDLELGEFDVTLHRQLTPAWGAYVVVAAAVYGGGALDGIIEQVHLALGLSQAGRHGLKRDQFNIVMDLESLQYVQLDGHSRSGLLDPTFGLRYSGLRLPEPWSLALEGAVKVPVAGHRNFLSTGRADVGLQASLARRGSNHAVYASLGVVDYGGSESDAQPEARIVPTLVLGLDSHLTGRLHSIVQLYASPSLYDSRDTRLGELTSPKYQLSLGLRYRREAQLFTFAVTENLANMNNTPDVGFQLGWTYWPPF